MWVGTTSESRRSTSSGVLPERSAVGLRPAAAPRPPQAATAGSARTRFARFPGLSAATQAAARHLPAAAPPRHISLCCCPLGPVFPLSDRRFEVRQEVTVTVFAPRGYRMHPLPLGDRVQLGDPRERRRGGLLSATRNGELGLGRCSLQALPEAHPMPPSAPPDGSVATPLPAPSAG